MRQQLGAILTQAWKQITLRLAENTQINRLYKDKVNDSFTFSHMF
jgi:hypothetical protein